MIDKDEWQKVSDYYKTLTPAQKHEWNEIFRQILQEEIDKEVVAKIQGH